MNGLDKIPLCVVCDKREYNPDVSFTVPDSAGQDAYIMVCEVCIKEKGYMTIIMEYLS